jgi:hypothetical protein
MDTLLSTKWRTLHLQKKEELHLNLMHFLRLKRRMPCTKALTQL